MSLNTVPFPIHIPKGPQNKIVSADFTGLEKQAPVEERGLISSTPEGYFVMCIGAVEAGTGEG